MVKLYIQKSDRNSFIQSKRQWMIFIMVIHSLVFDVSIKEVILDAIECFLIRGFWLKTSLSRRTFTKKSREHPRMTSNFRLDRGVLNGPKKFDIIRKTLSDMVGFLGSKFSKIIGRHLWFVSQYKTQWQNINNCYFWLT